MPRVWCCLLLSSCFSPHGSLSFALATDAAYFRGGSFGLLRGGPCGAAGISGAAPASHITCIRPSTFARRHPRTRLPSCQNAICDPAPFRNPCHTHLPSRATPARTPRSPVRPTGTSRSKYMYINPQGCSVITPPPPPSLFAAIAPTSAGEVCTIQDTTCMYLSTASAARIL